MVISGLNPAIGDPELITRAIRDVNPPIFQSADIKGLLKILETWGINMQTTEKGEKNLVLSHVSYKIMNAGTIIGNIYGNHFHKHSENRLVFQGKGVWHVINHPIEMFDEPCILYAPPYAPHILSVEEDLHFFEKRYV